MGGASTRQRLRRHSDSESTPAAHSHKDWPWPEDVPASFRPCQHLLRRQSLREDDETFCRQQYLSLASPNCRRVNQSRALASTWTEEKQRGVAAPCTPA